MLVYKLTWARINQFRQVSEIDSALLQVEQYVAHLGKTLGVGGQFGRVGGFLPTYFACKKMPCLPFEMLIFCAIRRIPLPAEHFFGSTVPCDQTPKRHSLTPNHVVI